MERKSQLIKKGKAMKIAYLVLFSFLSTLSAQAADTPPPAKERLEALRASFKKSLQAYKEKAKNKREKQADKAADPLQEVK